MIQYLDYELMVTLTNGQTWTDRAANAEDLLSLACTLALKGVAQQIRLARVDTGRILYYANKNGLLLLANTTLWNEAR